MGGGPFRREETDFFPMVISQQVTKDEERWQMMNKGARRVIDDSQW